MSRRPGPKIPPLPPLERIVALARAGVPRTVIADALGITRETFRRWVAGEQPEPKPGFRAAVLAAEAEACISLLERANRGPQGAQWVLERRFARLFAPHHVARDVEAELSSEAHDDARTAVADLLAKAREEWERERKAGV